MDFSQQSGLPVIQEGLGSESTFRDIVQDRNWVRVPQENGDRTKIRWSCYYHPVIGKPKKHRNQFVNLPMRPMTAIHGRAGTESWEKRCS